MVKLLEIGGRPVTVLDGNFAGEPRRSESGILESPPAAGPCRIGFLASEITSRGGIAICAPAVSDDSLQNEVPRHVEPSGGLVLVHLSAGQRESGDGGANSRPLGEVYPAIPEQREISGLAAGAKGTALTLCPQELSTEDATREVLLFLKKTGYIRWVRGERRS